jgi:subtilisin family serine protease
MAAPAAPALAPAAASATMTSGWERVAPLGSRTSSTSIVSWQGTAATAFTDRWVVKASDPAITSQSLTAVFKSRTATRTWTATSLGEGYFSVVAPKAAQSSVLAWANATLGIAFAQPDFVVTGSAVPNDPSYGQLWGLNNTTNPTADIDAPAAWDVTTGSRNTVVAVIDTGVDYNHPDLATNMWRNPGETPGDRIDNDGNGFIDDVYGWDFFNNDADPMDDHSHGTHCAGTIGAVGNNGVGVVGVNWQVSMMAMKFMGASNTGPLSAAISSLNYVTMMRRDHGVNVVATNNSWGGGGYNLDIAKDNNSKQRYLILRTHPESNYRKKVVIWLNLAKEKKTLYRFMPKAGFEPTTIFFKAKPDVNFASTLVPSSGTCPGFTGLGGN